MHRQSEGPFAVLSQEQTGEVRFSFLVNLLEGTFEQFVCLTVCLLIFIGFMDVYSGSIIHTG